MRQTELHLTDADRALVDEIRSKGLHQAREVNRASSCPHWTVVCQYDKGDEARVTALACSTPPAGRQRWTMMELERAARQEPGMAKVSRETVRRMLKKIYL